MLIVFIIFNVLIVAIVATRVVFWIQHNPPQVMEGKFAGRLIYRIIYYTLDVWSEIMFWVTFFGAGYWFVVYKMQANAYRLLPSLNTWEIDYIRFYAVFGIISVFRIIVIIMRIIQQVNVDLFFIDWEKPNVKVEGQIIQSQVIVWRSIFVANEFNELQATMRYIRPETTLIWVAFFLSGLNMQQYAQADPDMDKDIDLNPINYILKFFLVAFTFLCVAAV